MIGFEDDVAAAATVATAGTALCDIGLSMKGDAPLATVTRPRINFDLINKHNNKKGEAGASPQILESRR